MPRNKQMFTPTEDTEIEIDIHDPDSSYEYEQADELAIPNFADADQFHYRWIRARVGNDDDVNSISRRMREGWTFVQKSDLPEGFGVFPALKSGISLLDGCVMNGDLVLAKLPRVKSQAIQRSVERRAADAEAAYDAKRIMHDEDGVRMAFSNSGRKRASVGRNARFEG